MGSSRTSSRASTIALVASNLVPLLGVIALGWDLGTVLLIYWAESAVIALFNALKMIRIDSREAWKFVPFFLAHFGVFMAVHLVFLSVFLMLDAPEGQGTSLFGPMASRLDSSWWFAVAAMVISYGLTFVVEFLGKRQYEGRTIMGQMMAPYGRVMLMHVVILVGALPVMLLGGAWPLVVLLVLFKLVAELRSSGSRARTPRP
ncbi:MAG: DUF6498-containing protein [Planctomycetota bacterium]|nr:DUF6498-containing protein [Planctomycetota bacterium]